MEFICVNDSRASRNTSGRAFDGAAGVHMREPWQTNPDPLGMVGVFRPRHGELVRAPDYHSITAAPQVNPAPKTTRRIRSPRRMRPMVTASSSAIATEAAEVLP